MAWVRFERPDAERLAKAMALAPKHIRPQVDGMGRKTFMLLNEQSPEFKALKIKIAPQLCPMGPEHRASAALMGLLPPDVLRGEYATYREAVDASLEVPNGWAFFYGLQTSAIVYGDAVLAEEIVRSERRTRVILCWENELFVVLGEKRMDELMLEMTEKWNCKRDMLLWGLLEHHKAWSETLSRRIIAAVREGGAESKNVMWSFGGNGFALYMHPSLIGEAIEALEPWWRTQGNAKRWRGKLKKRVKG